jgi:hypothetical protein
MPPPEPPTFKVNNFQLSNLEDSDALEDSDYATSDTSSESLVEEESEEEEVKLQKLDNNTDSSDAEFLAGLL